jgi:mono/diheme cytochrome c family protein
MLSRYRVASITRQQKPTSASRGRWQNVFDSLRDTTKTDRKGYRLVVCDPTGTNAFFLRDGVAPHLAAATVAEAYRPAVDRWNLEGVPAAADQASVAAGDTGLVEV